MAQPPIAPHHYIPVEQDRNGSMQQIGQFTQGLKGSVTQATSISTAVTLNAPAGQVTLVSSTLAAETQQAIVVNDTLIGSNNQVLFQIVSYSGTQGAPMIWGPTSIVAGTSFTVTLYNASATHALNGIVVFNYWLY